MKESTIAYPSPVLSPYIKYYWVLKTDDAEPFTVQTIPSGCVHLVFHRGARLYVGEGSAQPRNFIRGQFSTGGALLAAGGIDMIAVVLHPLGLSPFVRCSMRALHDRYTDVEDLEDRELNGLRRAVASEEDAGLCIGLIERFFMGRLFAADDDLPRIRRAIDRIVDTPQVGVEALSDAACWGYRHFERVFAERVGLTPRAYCRVVRFQRALYVLQHDPRIDMANLACSCGFYDASHLVKDFKAFSGCSPTRYVSSRTVHSTLFSGGSRLNVIHDGRPCR